MLYIDFVWDLSPQGIIVDDEIDFKKLGWQEGDYFKIVTLENGKRLIQKVDTLEKFVIQGKINGFSN